MTREYEVILFGATGYTGKLTAEYITTHLPTNLKWAIAGRSASKLGDVVQELRALNPDRPSPGIEIADLNFESLSALAKKTCVVITTVGPYSKLGEPVIEACVKNSTHCLDCSGEIPWISEMIKKYDLEAKANGAIIIPACGVESVPADIVSWALVTLIREKLSKSTKEVILSLVGASGRPSGGTLETGLTIPEVYSLSQIAESTKPWALSPVEGVRYGRSASLLGLRTVPDIGTLAVSPIASIDRSIVHRTWGLLDGGKAYGANFRFNEYIRVRNAFIGIIVRVVYGIVVTGLLFPPIRWLVKNLVYAPGQGPSRETFTTNHIKYKAVAIADDDSPSAQRALATMEFQGNGYYLTGLFLAEAAITILRDDTIAKTLGGGFLTPATLGQPFINRLTAAKFSLHTRILDH